MKLINTHLTFLFFHSFFNLSVLIFSAHGIVILATEIHQNVKRISLPYYASALIWFLFFTFSHLSSQMFQHIHNDIICNVYKNYVS